MVFISFLFQLSPEKAEEAKLNAKYGKVKPGGSDFLRKKLNKGVSVTRVSAKDS